MRKGIRIVTSILGGMLVACLLALVISQVLGIRYFSVLSGSMEPEIPVGSLVITAPEQFAGEPQVGDVVSFVADENLTVVTHRVVENNASETTLTTQGDANNAPDPAVLKANIVGTVVFSIPGVGYPLAYLATTTGKIIAITAIVVAMLVLTIVNLVGRKEAKKKLVITFDDERDLTPQTFSHIVQGLNAQGINVKKGEQ